ncbi:MAG TPA: HAMP domain-containing sensor histidine kinase [Acidobacteriaceae bacterium]|jgi:signal transduction histidine kinase|nr:HAMP domain-containing sensor histidine kinase [Acidobacteriaceae bacterium]
MQPGKGVRTRALLLAAMAVVIATATLASLLLIRHRLLNQVTQGLSANLGRSVSTFQDLQAQRLKALDRENALVADMPLLKSLMTTNDPRTIENEAVDWRNRSGSDLFGLADMEGHVVAALANSSRPDAGLAADLQTMLDSSGTLYLVSGDQLFACSVRPLYFGSEASGALLGYVISGFAIDRSLLDEISRATMVDATFISGNQVLASTLPTSIQGSLIQQFKAAPQPEGTPLDLGGEKYLAVTTDLTSRASRPLHLVVLRSFSAADRSIRQIDQLVLAAGLVAMVLGTLLMLALSHAVTRPLEELAAGVRAFGSGDSAHLLPYRGTREVRDLSASFSKMRHEIQQTNRALLESERLATIGRMASSVSHDLRHYLAAVYANAEFLASARLTEAERSEILADIHTAVYGTTELLESLLTFSRTGSAIRRSPEIMATLLERAIALVQKHPDAGNVSLTANYGEAARTLAVVDTKQIERALYNLLLNACQARSAPADGVHVTATLEVQGDQINFEVRDDGAGVPDDIRTSLFQPFVSQGKQKGSGLGLTLAHCIAAEHGGYLVLVSSRPGETIFRMSIARGLLGESVFPEKSETEVANEA